VSTGGGVCLKCAWYCTCDGCGSSCAVCVRCAKSPVGWMSPNWGWTAPNLAPNCKGDGWNWPGDDWNCGWMGRVTGATPCGEESEGGVLGRGEGEKSGIFDKISAVSSCEGTNASSCARLRLAGFDFGFDSIFVICPIFVVGPIFTGGAIFVTGGVEDPIFISASISSSRSEVGLRPNDPIWNFMIGAMRCCVGDSAR
jgi:hypothetical protein